MQDYTVRSTRTRTDSAARRVVDVLVILLVCAAITVFIFGVLLVPMKVGGSNVIELASGDIVLIDRVSKYLTDYSIGDIVRAETEAGEAFYRVAALGGSTYLVRNGKAYLDGALIDESAYSVGWSPERELRFTVPENEVLLLPDDRTGITHLTGWSVLMNNIQGEVRFRVAPLKRLAFFY